MNDGWIAVAADAHAEAGRTLPVLRARVAILTAGSRERLALAAEVSLWQGRAAAAQRVLDAYGLLDDAPLPVAANPLASRMAA